MILRSDQVSSDCIVVDERAHNDVDVPDGVGQGDDPIALEEYHAKQIDGAACLKVYLSKMYLVCFFGRFKFNLRRNCHFLVS